MGMHIAYIAITALVALANAYAAALNFAGAESIKLVASHVQVSQKWMIPFGVLLASGAFGLLGGFALPVLGLVAAIGLILYFMCALCAHLRVHDPGIAGAVSFFLFAVAALMANLGYHDHW
jgi:hypothetical protein